MPTTPFLNMFGRSPIRPLEAHMSKVNACVKELDPYFEAVLLQKWSDAELIQQDIVRLENEADDLKRDLRLHLPKGLFLPVSRSDLLELLTVQDRLANKAKDIAGLVLGRKMIFPEVVALPFTDFLQCCLLAAQKANTAINELDELLETGFSGSEIKLRHIVFDLENSLPPVNVMFLYKIIEWTGELADRAREIGDRLQILLAK